MGGTGITPHGMARHLAALLAVASLAVIGAGAAAAATAPSATTGPVNSVGPTTATVTGTVNPNGTATSWQFEYGTTTGYGSVTASANAGSGTSSVPVSFALTGLKAGTTYHYRLVATNASGTKFGGDKSFKTQKTPPQVTLGASPTRIVFGGSTTLSGQFTPSPGTTAAGVKVTLQQDGAPFNLDYKAAATTKTDATGHFSFAQMPSINTTYRAVVASNPRATSLPVVVAVAFRVTLSLSTAHPRRGTKVVFSGTVGPLRNGGLVRVQKRVRGAWRTVKSAILGPAPGGALSAYRIGVRIRRGGLYRVSVPGDTQNVGGTSRQRRIRPR